MLHTREVSTTCTTWYRTVVAMGPASLRDQGSGSNLCFHGSEMLLVHGCTVPPGVRGRSPRSGIQHLPLHCSTSSRMSHGRKMDVVMSVSSSLRGVMARAWQQRYFCTSCSLWALHKPADSRSFLWGSGPGWCCPLGAAGTAEHH